MLYVKQNFGLGYFYCRNTFSKPTDIVIPSIAFWKKYIKDTTKNTLFTNPPIKMVASYVE